MLMAPNRAGEGRVMPKKWMSLHLDNQNLLFCCLDVMHIALELTEKFRLLSER